MISRAYRWLMDEGALLDGRALDHWRKEQVAAEFRQYTQQKATLPYILTPPTTESEFRHRPLDFGASASTSSQIFNLPSNHDPSLA